LSAIDCSITAYNHRVATASQQLNCCGHGDGGGRKQGREGCQGKCTRHHSWRAHNTKRLVAKTLLKPREAGKHLILLVHVRMLKTCWR